ncbi:SAM-dependent methyltransferase [Cognatishimia maritima]|uniref:Cyclopropane-fatty-acyl-phospholipid synthase n=1 Tax=Cognatishimia maritima TaxID=870908 RepID=A0A1M5VVM6_9RHOB|nr:cyclopropane-fatty-acyl-phospholipid synthase family protein [Cognatishimia maritima]SHH79044.1 cyclopropane-fatty-acyl-phospholipid synthase [Cognatishimia maritima]
MTLLTDAVKHEFLNACGQIKVGRLRLRTPDGQVHHFGDSGEEGDMDIKDWSVITALAARGDVGLGETYVAGLWETTSIERLVAVALRNLDTFEGFANPSRLNRFKFLIVDRLLRANSVKGASRNIKAHYDVGNEFYQLWLDPGMTYSSALFSPEDSSLQQAQTRKYDRVLSRLGDGERVLEIGCGWGGFAERAADQGRAVTGLTISPSQKGYAEARLDGSAEIRLEDYRKTEGTYDNIVSIEMIEAVGEKYWPSYFNTLKARLAESGRAVVQAITVQDSYFDLYRRGSDYIRQYTFPGGMLLSDAVIADQARRAGLTVCDNFAFGQDYARTCRLWAERLRDQSEKVLTLGYDRQFLRSWVFYLEICAASFAVGQTDVVQVELAHA